MNCLRERDKFRSFNWWFKVGFLHLIYNGSYILIRSLEVAESKIVKDAGQGSQQALDVSRLDKFYSQ